MNYQDWDKWADENHPGWDNGGDMGRYDGFLGTEKYADNPRPYGPSRKPSSLCQASGNPYCTCDTCF